MDDAFRALPAVDQLAARLSPEMPAALRVDAAREALTDARERIRKGEAAASQEELEAAAAGRLRAAIAPALRPVINATGVVLQTNLGRAPLSARALAAMEQAARGYSNLEFDLGPGRRGSRNGLLTPLIRRITGAEDALVVNNNASGLFFALHALAAGRGVVVSRGQAVEIGGGFRIPEILRESGATLVEVGTTNRTYLRDYAAAVDDQTAAILRVHPSNFRVEGFTAEVSLAELAPLARERSVLLMDDLGSGCLVDTRRYGMAPEPTVQESVAAGVDLALFSGDKLLGGPQCGVIAGRAEVVQRLARHPLMRALRVDKLTLAALEATLLAYLLGTEAEEVPVWRMLGANIETLRARAEAWMAVAGDAGSVVASRSMVGGGSLPGEGVPTWCTALTTAHPDALAAGLRRHGPPVIARVQDGLVLLDPRTVLAEDDALVAGAVQATLRST